MNQAQFLKARGLELAESDGNGHCIHCAGKIESVPEGTTNRWNAYLMHSEDGSVFCTESKNAALKPAVNQ